MDAPDPPAVVSPVTLPFAGVDHANEVPATLLVKDTPVAFPEQIVCGFGVAVTTGIGLTVTGTEIGNPTQPLAVGVTVYVNVTGDVVVFVNTSVIEAPVPPAVVSPVTLAFAGVDHAKVVPATLLVSATPVAFPEQMV